MVRPVFCRGAILYGRRNSFVAAEGLPLLAVTAAVAVLIIRYAEPWYALAPIAVFGLLYLLFRDPHREIPSVALGVISPVDGEVLEIAELGKGALDDPAQSLLIRINSFGTYTARSPVEGKVMDLGKNALWLQTDEGDDVVLRFRGYRLGLAPRSFTRFGERLGQGQRCAYLRLAEIVEVQLPVDSQVLVEEGQTIFAGSDLLGNVPSPR